MWGGLKVKCHKGRNDFDNLMPAARPKVDHNYNCLGYMGGQMPKNTITTQLKSKKHKPEI